MYQDKTVTVILITYNHESTVSKAIESILEQETSFPFKIQIFEDCSTDGTLQICKKYAEKYPDKIELFANHKNLGAADNFKQALCQVDSKYWAYLEGDDYWCDINKIELCVDALERYPNCSMSGHNTKVCHLNSQKEDEYCLPNDGKDRFFSFGQPSSYIHMNARMYRTECVDFNKVPYIFYYDTPLYQLFLSKGDVYFINRVMSVYNISGKGTWTSLSSISQDFQHIRMNRFLKKYFSKPYNKFFMEQERNLYQQNIWLKTLRKKFKKLDRFICKIVYVVYYIIYLCENRKKPPRYK